MRNQTLHQRVSALSPSQQEMLAHKLGVSAQRLVAYVIPRSGEVDTSALRHVLKAKLPNYMVPAAIVPLPELPRTANGKIDTKALPAPQLGSTSASDAAKPRTEAEKILVQIWQAVLQLDAIGIYDNFFELGGDSILSIQIVSRAREAGLRLTPNQLFEQPTVAELAAVLNSAPDVAATQELVTGEVPLTPIQHWFFEQQMEMPQHWHQAILVEIPNGADVLNGALAMLWTHHDALRMGFDNNQQINADADNPPKLVQIDLSHLEESAQIQAVADHGSRLHGELNLTDGGLMRAVLFTRGTQPQWLLLSLHHLVVDAVSWHILLEDLSQLLNGVTQLPPKTTSFKTWAKALVSQTATRQSEIDFWLNQIEQPAISLPRDYPDAVSPIEATAQTVTVALSAEDTQALLQIVPAAYNTQINDALLTALAQTLLQWVGAASGSVRVEIEAHGREQIADDIDVSRTVGWFTTTYPVNLQIHNTDNCVETLKSVKEQLRQVPDRGIGYGMLRYLGEAIIRQQLTQAKPAEVLFNYLGQQSLSAKGLRVIQDIDVGLLRDPRNRRSYVLDVNAWVANGRLQINWRYDTRIHQSETVTMLANQYLSTLKTLIASCAEGDGFTPSDFPDADLDQTELDDFISQLTEEA